MRWSAAERSPGPDVVVFVSFTILLPDFGRASSRSIGVLQNRYLLALDHNQDAVFIRFVHLRQDGLRHTALLNAKIRA